MKTTLPPILRYLVLAAGFLAAASLHAADVARFTLWNKSNVNWKLEFPVEEGSNTGTITVEDTMNASLPADSLQQGKSLVLVSRHAYIIAYTLKSKWFSSNPPSSRKFLLYDPSGKDSEEFYIGYPESLAHKANKKSLEHNVKNVLKLNLEPASAADTTFVRSIHILKDAYEAPAAP